MLHLKGRTFHARKGAIANRFTYGVDYLLLDAEHPAPAPGLFARNAPGLASLNDRDHGGAPGAGRGAAWVRDTLADRGLPQPDRIRLLAQPRLLGHVFNPVAFWLCEDGLGLRLVIAEVTNTWGQRHSYLCHHDDLRPIGPGDEVRATKIFHVSPFQTPTGAYAFRFDIGPDRIAITIDYQAGEAAGVLATLSGPLFPLTNRGLLGACLRRPFGSRRVLALIHWQALKLWRKGARFTPPPAPPGHEVSR